MDGLAKTGSEAFTAQIVIKKGGAIVHREAETFDREQAANAWIVKREAELKRPGGLERKEDPTLAAVIDCYVAESKTPVSDTKAQILKTIKNSDLGRTKCSDITSQRFVSFARELTKNVEPQTCKLLLASVQHLHGCPTRVGISASARRVRVRTYRSQEAWPATAEVQRGSFRFLFQSGKWWPVHEVRDDAGLHSDAELRLNFRTVGFRGWPEFRPIATC